MSPESSALFRKNSVALQALFNTYASNDQISLEQFFSLCSDFDLFPTFLNRDGIVTCFGKFLIGFLFEVRGVCTNLCFLVLWFY